MIARHFLPISAERIRFITFQGEGPLDQDTESIQKLLAVSGWDAVAREHRLAIVGLNVEQSQEGPVGVVQLAQFRQPSHITALQVADLGEGRVMCLLGGSDGCLRRLQLSVPQQLGADPADIEVTGHDSFQGELLPWHALHSSSVTSLDVNASTGQVVSAGLDGTIHVTSADSSPSSTGGASKPHVPGRTTLSYRAVHWASPDTFVAAGTKGGLEVWDKRTRGLHPAARSPLSYGLTGASKLDKQRGMQRQIHCVDVHPAQPFKCCTGASQGCVAVWDLRFTQAPTAAALHSADAGDVWEVQFEPGTGEQASVVFCADDGSLSRYTEAEPAPAAGVSQFMFGDLCSADVNGFRSRAHGGHIDSIYNEQCASILSLDVEAGLGGLQDIYCVTDQTCLVHIREHSRH